jgi:hypothetical protein
VRGGECEALAQMLPVAVRVRDCVGVSVEEREAELLRLAIEGEGGGEDVKLSSGLLESVKELDRVALAQTLTIAVMVCECEGESVGEGDAEPLAQRLPLTVRVRDWVSESVGEREALALRVAAERERGGEGEEVAQKLAVNEELRDIEGQSVNVGEWELLNLELVEGEGSNEKEAAVLTVEASDFVGESVGERNAELVIDIVGQSVSEMDAEPLRVTAEGDFRGVGEAVAQPLIVCDDAGEDDALYVDEGGGDLLRCVLAEREAG